MTASNSFKTLCFAALAAVALFAGGIYMGYHSDRWLPLIFPPDPTAPTTAPSLFAPSYLEKYPNLLPLDDPDLGLGWVRRYEHVAASTLPADGFTFENGRPRYAKDGVHSLYGVDVSEHQGTIDWQAVKADGVEFAMLRIGYRGYSYGGVYEDAYFEYNLREAQAAGLKVGVYFFSQATTREEAIEEAAFVLQTLDGRALDLPVVFDWESISYDEARTDYIESEQLTLMCRAFCDTVKAGGYEPMLYMYKVLAYHSVTLGDVADVPFWISELQETPSFYYRYSMWQYSYSGSVAGIGGGVDVNLCFVNEDGSLYE